MFKLKNILLGITLIIPALAFASADTESVTGQLVKQHIAWSVLYTCENVAAQRIQAMQTMNAFSSNNNLQTQKVKIFNECVNGMSPGSSISKTSTDTMQLSNTTNEPILTKEKIKALSHDGNQASPPQSSDIY